MKHPKTNSDKQFSTPMKKNGTTDLDAHIYPQAEEIYFYSTSKNIYSVTSKKKKLLYKCFLLFRMITILWNTISAVKSYFFYIR